MIIPIIIPSGRGGGSFGFKEFALCLVLITQVMFGLFGLMEGSIRFRPHCGFNKRWHYVFPTQPVGCYVGQWLNEKT